MSRACVLAVCLSLLTVMGLVGAPPSASAQQRDATRERLRAALAVSGPKIGVHFKQSTKNAYNFIGTATTNLKNAESFEIVVSATESDTIGFRIYPHYKGGYINLDRVQDRAKFARHLLYLSDQNFLFWGVDDSNDAFCGFTFTLESGFPTAAIDVVVRSIPNQDKYVGQLRPFIDGSSGL
ncbi:MAG TPA: hypothetical protein VKX28_31895 [Xanthobacteraceae bacterium]|nr:hypothetical protein [Xanthobacteraceae bacterium]